MKFFAGPEEDEDIEIEEPVEKIPRTWTAYRVTAYGLAKDWNWTWGETIEEETGPEEPRAFATELMGDGKGIWHKDDTYINREHITSISIVPIPKTKD